MSEHKKELDIRCPQCGRKLAENINAEGAIKFKCPRCKTFSVFQLATQENIPANNDGK